jgi:hypothetical protein
LARTRKYSQNRVDVNKIINVISVQTIYRSNKLETLYTTVGLVSEKAFLKRRKQTTQRFHQLLDDALSISNYIDQMVARGRHPTSIVHIDDLPEIDQFAEGDWGHIRLSRLFDSYRVEASGFQPATTFGSPESMAVTLQSRDLRQPHKPVALNGHHMKFKAMKIGGDTFFLPTGVCRLRHGWKLFIRHKEGVWCDEVGDLPGCSPDTSLKSAWIYFVSQLRILAPSSQQLAPISVQRCFTGIEGGTFLIGYRRCWQFQLRYSQKDHHGRRHHCTIRTWREDTLTDASLRDALLQLAARDSYRIHLQAADPDSVVAPDTPVPFTFLPSDPVIPISADDLLYEVDQRSRPL